MALPFVPHQSSTPLHYVTREVHPAFHATPLPQYAFHNIAPIQQPQSYMQPTPNPFLKPEHVQNFASALDTEQAKRICKLESLLEDSKSLVTKHAEKYYPKPRKVQVITKINHTNTVLRTIEDVNTGRIREEESNETDEEVIQIEDEEEEDEADREVFQLLSQSVSGKRVAGKVKHAVPQLDLDTIPAKKKNDTPVTLEISDSPIEVYQEAKTVTTTTTTTTTTRTTVSNDNKRKRTTRSQKKKKQVEPSEEQPLSTDKLKAIVKGIKQKSVRENEKGYEKPQRKKIKRLETKPVQKDVEKVKQPKVVEAPPQKVVQQPPRQQQQRIIDLSPPENAFSTLVRSIFSE
jgi:hypothetical protein